MRFRERKCSIDLVADAGKLETDNRKINIVKNVLIEYFHFSEIEESEDPLCTSLLIPDGASKSLVNESYKVAKSLASEFIALEKRLEKEGLSNQIEVIRAPSFKANDSSVESINEFSISGLLVGYSRKIDNWNCSELNDDCSGHLFTAYKDKKLIDINFGLISNGSFCTGSNLNQSVKFELERRVKSKSVDKIVRKLNSTTINNKMFKIFNEDPKTLRVGDFIYDYGFICRISEVNHSDDVYRFKCFFVCGDHVSLNLYTTKIGERSSDFNGYIIEGDLSKDWFRAVFIPD